jgi:hypothetical protein
VENPGLSVKSLSFGPSCTHKTPYIRALYVINSTATHSYLKPIPTYVFFSTYP